MKTFWGTWQAARAIVDKMIAPQLDTADRRSLDEDLDEISKRHQLPRALFKLLPTSVLRDLAAIYRGEELVRRLNVARGLLLKIADQHVTLDAKAAAWREAAADVSRCAPGEPWHVCPLSTCEHFAIEHDPSGCARCDCKRAFSSDRA